MLQQNKMMQAVKEFCNEYFEVEDTSGHDYSAFVVGYYGEQVSSIVINCNIIDAVCTTFVACL